MTKCIVKGQDLANQGSVKVFSAASDNIQICMHSIKLCVKMSKKLLYKLPYFKHKTIKNLSRTGKSNNCLTMSSKPAAKKRRLENSFLTSWLRKPPNSDVTHEEENNNEVLEAPSEISTPVPTTLAEPSKSKTTESKKRKTGFCKTWQQKFPWLQPVDDGMGMYI